MENRKRCGKYGELELGNRDEILREKRKDGEAFEIGEFEKFIASDRCYESQAFTWLTNLINI